MKNILTRRRETLFNNFFVFQQNPKQGAHTRQAHSHHIRSRLVRGEAADFAGFPSALKTISARYLVRPSTVTGYPSFSHLKQFKKARLNFSPKHNEQLLTVLVFAVVIFC